MESFRSGEVVGNGSAINVELGWIPDRVEVYNATDGDEHVTGFCNRLVIPFSSGGTTEIAAGDVIEGATSGATAKIASVLLYSGTWAGGDAAGFFVAERDDITGTFQSEDAGVDAANHSTVTVQVEHGYTVILATAAVVTTEAILGYVGASGSNSKGFIIPSGLAEEAKLLRWCAWRNDR